MDAPGQEKNFRAGAEGSRRQKVLLFGASGRLGGQIASVLSRCSGIELLALARSQFDFSRDAAEENLRRCFAAFDPDVVVNCIAMSDVDRCETEHEAATLLNKSLPALLARQVAQRQARLIHFSTDFVFDGSSPGGGDERGRRPYRESDAANPLSVYGSSKLAGERVIADSGCRHWIFRVSWLYGSPAANLAARLLEPCGGDAKPIGLAVDRFGTPNPVQLIAAEVAACILGTGAKDSALAQPTIQTEAPSGVYHLSCHGVTTWHDFGQEFLRQAIRTGRIDAREAPRIEAFVESTQARPARRPNSSGLDSALYERSFGRSLPQWQAAIPLALSRRTQTG